MLAWFLSERRRDATTSGIFGSSSRHRSHGCFCLNPLSSPSMNSRFQSIDNFFFDTNVLCILNMLPLLLLILLPLFLSKCHLPLSSSLLYVLFFFLSFTANAFRSQSSMPCIFHIFSMSDPSLNSQVLDFDFWVLL